MISHRQSIHRRLNHFMHQFTGPRSKVHRVPSRARRWLFVTAVVSALTACSDSPTKPDTELVNIKGRTFRLELAVKHAARIQGLSDRKTIAADSGMLFAFERAEPREFVMRRCVFPIDLVFLDANGYVIRMHRMQVEPDPHAPNHKLRRYGSGDPTQFAIELRGGMLDELDLELADQIELPTLKLQRLLRE